MNRAAPKRDAPAAVQYTEENTGHFLALPCQRKRPWGGQTSHIAVMKKIFLIMVSATSFICPIPKSFY